MALISLFLSGISQIKILLKKRLYDTYLFFLYFVFSSFVSVLFYLFPQNPDIASDEDKSNYRGIIWTSLASWNEVIKLAKLQNKYIFVDCYTFGAVLASEWMNEVYTSEKVGMLFNSSFISVKLQMDSSKNDKRKHT